LILTNKSILKQISSVLLTDIVIKFLSFCILPLYLNLMSKTDFGEFGFIFTTAIMASTLMSLSLYTLLIKHLSKKSSKNLKNKKISTLTIGTIISNLIILSIVVLLELNFNIVTSFFNITSYKTEKILLITLIIFINVISLFQYAILISRKNSMNICLFLFFKFFFSNVISLILLKYNIFYYDTVFLRLTGILLGELTALPLILILIKIKYIKFHFNYLYFKTTFLKCTPLIIASLLSLIMITVDRKILQFNFGNAILAEYNLVYILLLPLGMICQSISSILVPNLFSIKNSKLAFSEIMKSMLLIFFILILASIGIYILIKITFYFGIIKKDYNNVLTLFIAMFFGSIFGHLNNYLDTLNLYINKTIYKLLTTILIVLIFSIMNLILIPIYSYYGIAISLFIANFLGFIFGYFLLHHRIKNVQ
jgi:O-antigen/teichoic acid export membrane protein